MNCLDYAQPFFFFFLNGRIIPAGDQGIVVISGILLGSEDNEINRQFADGWVRLKRGYKAHTEQCLQLDVASIHVFNNNSSTLCGSLLNTEKISR